MPSSFSTVIIDDESNARDLMRKLLKACLGFGFLVNISPVKSFQQGEEGVVIFSNGVHLDVSRQRKAEFMRYFVR